MEVRPNADYALLRVPPRRVVERAICAARADHPDHGSDVAAPTECWFSGDSEKGPTGSPSSARLSAAFWGKGRWGYTMEIVSTTLGHIALPSNAN